MDAIESLLKKINMEEVGIDNSHYMYLNQYPVPRVTEILSAMLHQDFLMTWSNAMGLYKRKKYKDILDQAATKGTYVHNGIEDFLQNNNELNIDEVLPAYQMEVSFAYGSFRKWWDMISNKVSRIIMQEQPLVCPWFGGTLDLLIEINGKIYLLDFKTSNHGSFKYFLQLAAYRYILRIHYGILVDGVGIIQLNKKEINFTEYIIDNSHPEYEEFIQQCETTFLSIVHSYLNRIMVEQWYDRLF